MEAWVGTSSKQRTPFDPKPKVSGKRGTSKGRFESSPSTPYSANTFRQTLLKLLDTMAVDLGVENDKARGRIKSELRDRTELHLNDILCRSAMNSQKSICLVFVYF